MKQKGYLEIEQNTFTKHSSQGVATWYTPLSSKGASRKDILFLDRKVGLRKSDITKLK